MLRVGVWSLIGLLVLLAGLAFVASRAVTLQWATEQMVRFADGKLQVEGIAGSALTGISADFIQWQDGPVTIALTSPRFTYHPFAMLDGLVRIESISAANVALDLPSSAGAADARQTLRMPAMASMLPVAIERVDVGRLVVRRGGRQLADLRDLELALRHDGDRIGARLNNLTVIADNRRIGVKGEAAVLARAPYPTDGRLAVRLPMQPEALRLDVRINGPIEELAVRVATVLAGAAVDARTVVHTLDPRPLRQVRVDLKDLDLSRHDASLPATSLAGSYVAEVMPVWASERRPLLIGPLNLTNALAGPLDRNRLPVAQAKAVVGFTEGGLQIQGLQASGPVGEVTGEGWVGPDSVQLTLESDKFNLQAIDSSVVPRTVKARIALERAGEGGLGVEATAADASLAAELKAVIGASRQLQISRAQVQFKGDGRSAAAGRASFLGTVGLNAPWAVDLSGSLRDFNPGRLLPAPSARLNGTWRVSGQLAGEEGTGQLQGYLALDESRLRDLALNGRLAATLKLKDRQPQQLSAVHGNLRWGSGTIEAAGDLGGADDVLRIDGRELADDAGGIPARIAGAALRVQTASLQSGALRIQARLEGVDVGPASAGSGSAVAGLRLSRVDAVVDGGRARHRIEVDAVGAGQHLVVRAMGGIEAGLWRGIVDRLDASHPLLGIAEPALRLQQPFDLIAGNGRFTAYDARFELHEAHLDVRQVDWRAPLLALNASASGLAAQRLVGLLPGRAGLQAPLQDLTLSATLDFAGNLAHAARAGWRGGIRLQRERGDVLLSGAGGGSAAPAGLRTLQASLSIADRNLDLVVNLDGEHVGRMAIEASTALPSRNAGSWTAAAMAASPLSGRLELALNTFGWIPQPAQESWQVDGALSARLQLAGTLGNPSAQGTVTGSNLSAHEKTLGMQLRNGVLAADLTGDRVDVRLLRFESGAGSVAVSGLPATADSGRSPARLVLDQLPIPLGSGQQVILSGSTTATLAQDAVSVNGRLVADEGLIELDGGGAAGLDADPVDADLGKLRSFGLHTDLEVDLGRRFRVEGSGLDTRLRGVIRLRGNHPMATHASGTVDLANGNYRFLDRRLRIERGRLVFEGPLDDPALDIVAVRDNQKVEAGFWIGGTAVSPVARLVSTPSVPDADKLAWLVLGGNLAGTRGAGQQRALQRAATALFGNADDAGVDRVTADDLAGPVAQAGRRLGFRLSETYGRSLRGVWSVLRLQHDIADRLSLGLQAGRDGAVELIRSVVEDDPS